MDPIQGEDGKTFTTMILSIGEESIGFSRDNKGRLTYGKQAAKCITFPERYMPSLIKFFQESPK